MKPLINKTAVVGMSGIFPGALDLAQFCRNIMEKRESIIDIPDDRWIIKAEDVLSSHYRADTASSRRAGVVKGFKFDPDGFLVDRDLLLELDPLHHMVLHAGEQALAQCHSSQEIRKRTGVVLAAISLPTEKSSELAWQIVMEQRRAGNFKGTVLKDGKIHRGDDFNLLTPADAFAAGMVSLPAALLARAMGLMGGSFTLDAACASSLYAIKIACEQLHSGRADMMVAGGVSRPDSLYTQIGFTQLKALSPSGRCSPFDKSADGLVVGEGAGVVVLKRVEDALSSGDHIWGVITGSGWSNDIEGNLVAPASEGQIRAMRAAYRAAGWSPADVQYIECHGSATPVGDNIELNSMSRLWQDADLGNQGCAIGSIKSMTGHLLTAAGAAGFIKTLLALNEKLLPPSLNFSEPAPNSPLLYTGFHVQTDPQEWQPMPLKGINGNSSRASRTDGNKGNHVARRAGISAFGFGGINGHILVEEFCKESLSIYFSETQQPGQSESEKKPSSADAPIAIVGMEVITPAAMNLEEFRKKIFRGERSFGCEKNASSKNLLPYPEKKELLSQGENCIRKDSIRKDSIRKDLIRKDGLWMEELTTCAGEFHIPPNQIEDLLPQHLIMLKAAMGAMKNANITPRPGKDDSSRVDFGAAIGIEFDYGATDFHLRWRDKLTESHTSDSDTRISPPLTAERTLGALGGIVASRIAREFKLGGPCFTVSAQAASGIKALEIAVESLRRRETKIFLCGCVDMAGDIRESNLNRTLRVHAYGFKGSSPFDIESRGVFPSEGAGALVLKTLEQAQQDGDRIYAVIKGTGGASGGDMADEARTVEGQPAPPLHQPHLNGSPLNEPLSQITMRQIYAKSLSDALDSSGVVLSDIGLYQAHGSGDPAQDAIEAEVLVKMGLNGQSRKPLSCAIGSTCATTGDTNSLSGLLSVIHATLALYHQITPPLPQLSFPISMDEIAEENGPPAKPRQSAWEVSGFHFPKFPSFWIKENFGDMRRGCAASITTDGTCSHVVLEEFTMPPDYPAKDLVDNERSLPLGLNHETILKESDAAAKVADSIGKRGIGKVAFLYPGSGNHFPGMGRGIGALFPDILRSMDEAGASLNRRMLPDLYYPRRTSWEYGWQDDAMLRINSHPHNMIFGQVSFGTLMTRVAERFGIRPDACIGHSLGETAGLFALRGWSDPEEMLTRMESSDLFTRKLAGECTAAASVWQLKAGEIPQWRVAAVNRSKDFVENRIKSGQYERLYLLIVNTPEECVVGGSQEQVERFIREAGCGAMYLNGVVTVHCPVAEMCREEYLDLHRFACHPPEEIDFYSCALGKRYIPETEATAQSILNQALYGFDYTRLINSAWEDGIRVFIEMGPGASCTRAVNKILGDRPHLALSLSSKDEDEETTLIRALCTLAANGVDLDMRELSSKERDALSVNKQRHSVTLPVHRLNSYIPDAGSDDVEDDIDMTTPDTQDNFVNYRQGDVMDSPGITSHRGKNILPPPFFNDLAASARITADAHMKFLQFSDKNMLELEKQFSCLTQIGSDFVNTSDGLSEVQLPIQTPLFDRDMCMEFAIGAASNVLGESFDVIDTYPVRVRLPGEPLMLVDRIMDIEGEMLSLKSGRIITQHDVKDGAWYLDGGKAPVSISIEAGQADLFLCSWLGIDHAVMGKRRYRLLDAKVTFHRTLPEPGETIEYHIEIDRFLKQGEIYLFFFHYKGFINSELLISMRDGCAGFFTPDEVRNSGGIILKKEDREVVAKKMIKDNIEQVAKKLFVPVVAVYREQYSDGQVERLRVGDLEGGFGKLFKGIVLGKNLRLPGTRDSKESKNHSGRMHLIDRVLSFDPEGGRFGMGFISAEADIHPDDWFLTCHFVDDMVMPGTLMYDCCAHALRIFTQRMGWVSTRDDLFYDVIPALESDLKCRGPVTTNTKKARYEIELKEMGYSPEPFVIADAHMFSDGHRIVFYKNMGMKIVGLSQKEIELFWSN